MRLLFHSTDLDKCTVVEHVKRIERCIISARLPESNADTVTAFPPYFPLSRWLPDRRAGGCAVRTLGFPQRNMQGQALVLEQIQVFLWKGRWMCRPCRLSTKTHETAGGCCLPTSDYPQRKMERQALVLPPIQAFIWKGRWVCYTLIKETWKGRRVCSPLFRLSDGRAVDLLLALGY